MQSEHHQNRVTATPAHGAPQGRGLTAIDGALALIAVLLVSQMWLLTTTLHLFLAGHREVALPAAILSALLFAGCFGLYWFIEGIDADVRAASGPPAADR